VDLGLLDFNLHKHNRQYRVWQKYLTVFNITGLKNRYVFLQYPIVRHNKPEQPNSVATPHSGYALAQWLRHCATNRKVARSVPEGVIGMFY
jgi:hypothetical protein